LVHVFAAHGWAGGTILVYGDSLSAAYGLTQDAGWPALLQARLTQKNGLYRAQRQHQRRNEPAAARRASRTR
jgi:acyl-CoA thioesterase-1